MNDIVTTPGNVYVSLNVLAILLCLLAAILVFGFRLCKTVVYRLALYHVLSSLFLALMDIIETVTFINYNSNPKLYDRLCKAIGWFGLYSQWVKLLLTMWVTIHLFCFAVLERNLKKLEVMYVVTSLLLPAVIAVVPLITNTYQYSIGTCYIYAPNDTTYLIENGVLWDVPAMSILLLSSSAMAVMVIKLARTVYLRSRYEEITDRDPFWKALQQLLPLAAFPLLFFIFFIPVFVFNVDRYSSSTTSPNIPLLFTISVCVPMWSITSGITLIAHVCVAKYRRAKRRRPMYKHIIQLALLREPLFV